jgi:hypothetical protein
MSIPLFALNAAQYQAVGLPLAGLMVCGSVVYVFSILARDVIGRRRETRQFSLATLLLVMTLMACVLGLAAVWAKYSAQ